MNSFNLRDNFLYALFARQKQLTGNHQGYSLLEVVIALSLWTMLALSASGLLVYASQTSTQALNEQEVFENARAAIDTITTNLQMADEILVENDPHDLLQHLTLTERDPEGKAANYHFYFNASAQPGTAKYHRLEFGLNDEFASYIESVALTLSEDKEALTVTIVTDDRLCPSLRFSRTTDIRYKKVTVKPYA